MGFPFPLLLPDSGVVVRETWRREFCYSTDWHRGGHTCGTSPYPDISLAGVAAVGFWHAISAT